MFFYEIERNAEIHRQELLRVAQQEQISRVYVGQPRVAIRRPLGRFLVRIGGRMIGEAQPEPQVVGPPKLAV